MDCNESAVGNRLRQLHVSDAAAHPISVQARAATNTLNLKIFISSALVVCSALCCVRIVFSLFQALMAYLIVQCESRRVRLFHLARVFSLPDTSSWSSGVLARGARRHSRRSRWFCRRA